MSSIATGQMSALEQEREFHLNMAVDYIDDSGVLGDLAVFSAGRRPTIAWIARSMRSRNDSTAETGVPRIVFLSMLDHPSPEFRSFCASQLPPERLCILDNLSAPLPEPSHSKRLALVYVEHSHPEVIEGILVSIFSNNLIAQGAVIMLENGMAATHTWQALALRFGLDFADAGPYGLCGRKYVIHSYDCAESDKLERERKLQSFERTESEKEVRKHLALAIEYILGADVKGDIAEFGTCEGRTAAWIADALSRSEKFYSVQKSSPLDERFNPKKLYLFDSFEGLPVAESDIDRAAPHVMAGVWHPASNKGLDSDQLRELCEQFMDGERIEIIAGWYKDSLKSAPASTRFSLIHIDCDLYQSTIDALGYLFEHEFISEGAALLFDDWNPNRGSPDFGERRAWTELTQKHSVRFSDWGSYGWGGQKFIVHSYTQGTG